jgi:hypothetical protein
LNKCSWCLLAISLLWAAPVSAQPGSPTASVNCTPYVTVVVVNSQAIIGSGSSVTIVGCNFGSSTGTVELCNASTYPASTVCVGQTEGAWTSTSVVISSVSVGSLAGFGYWYVQEAGGARNAIGLGVFLDAGPAAPPCTTSGISLTGSAIQGAIDSAAIGDVLCLSAGTATITGDSILFRTDKHVEVRGAGSWASPWGSASSGGTTLKAGTSGTAPGSIFILYEATTGHNILSNIRFEHTEGVEVQPTYGVVVAGTSSGDAWVVHHCSFELTLSTNGYGWVGIRVASKGGVIYRNSFENNPVSPYITTNQPALVHATNEGQAYWDTNHTRGALDTGDDSLYIEKNRFNQFAVTIDSTSQARDVIRFNEMHNATLSGHGYDSNVTGSRHREVYHNAFTCDDLLTLSAWIGTRGGTEYVFNNTFEAYDINECDFGSEGTGPAILIGIYKLAQCDFILGWPGLYPDSYPVAHQIGWGWINGSNSLVGEAAEENDPASPNGSNNGSGFDQALDPMKYWGNSTATATMFDLVGSSPSSCRLMTYNNQAKSSGTTLTLGGFVSAGQDVVVAFADLVGGSTPTIADDNSNTWTARNGGTNGSLRMTVWTSRITTGGDFMTVTITHDSSSAARAGMMGVTRGVPSSGFDKNPSVVTDDTSPYTSPSTGTLSQANEIVIGYYALQGPTTYTFPTGLGTDTIAVTTPSTFGSSGPSSTGWGGRGTTGGSDNTNVTIVLSQRSVTATTAVTPEITNSTANRTGLAGVLTFKTDGGTALDLAMSDFVVVDREYFHDLNKASVCPQSGGSCTSGIGSGMRTERPSNCTFNETTGVGPSWWSTDQGGNWDTTNGSANDGTLDVCTADNTWTNGVYTPRVYPHPLHTVN